MDLSECRKEIDKIDKELVELFERRMNVAIKVAEYKIENTASGVQFTFQLFLKE